ncbi:MAG: ferric reductase-like transmembrane domain-containing protein [Vicinamibacteria bacterium]|nr:ferric reductase-like transmembrane domain-containing protein [Vicinamibacteria bacterium]
MSRVPWHLRHFRAILYAAFTVSAIGVAAVCGMDDPKTPWIGARQLFGLWALGLLLTSMLIGPLTSVFRPFPFLGHLILGRRAVGIACFAFAVLHAMSYTATNLSLGGIPYFISEALAEGTLGVISLVVGAVVLVALGVLTATSFDHMLVKLGRRWKTIQNAVYLILPLALIHAVLLGADFGFHQARGVTGEPDIGALLGMFSLSAAWLALFVLRRRGFRKDISPIVARFAKKA